MSGVFARGRRHYQRPHISVCEHACREARPTYPGSFEGEGVKARLERVSEYLAASLV